MKRKTVARQLDWEVYIENVLPGGSVIFNNRPVPITLNTPPPVSLKEVFGREEDLKNVRALLDENDRIVLINGIGGIGKTTLAKAFLKRYRNDYKHIAWIDVSGKTADAFVYNSQLVDSLHLKDELTKLPKNQLISKGFALIINRMRLLDGKNLLFVDNVSPDSELKEIYDLLTVGENWKVITTSRSHLDGFEPYELEIMQPDAALAFFKYHYRREQNDVLIRQILHDIDYHTLLIEVLAKTGQKNKLALSVMAERIKKKGLNVVPRTSISIPHSSRRVHQIMAYLKEIFKLSSLTQEEKNLLANFSVLPSVHLHYESLIHLLQIPAKRRERFVGLLNNLYDKGWITEKNDSYRIHQVVQEVVRKILTPNSTNCHQLFQTYLAKFDPQKNANSLKNAYLLTFAEHFIDHMGSEKSVGLAKLCAWIGIANEVLGKFDELLKYDLRLVEIQKQLFSINSMEVADAYNNLGLTYVHLKKFRQALYFQNLALRIRTKIIPKEHSFFGRSYINLNFTYEQMQKYETALSYGKMAEANFEYAIEHPVPGDVDRDTIRKNLARVFNNLGYDYQKLGNNRMALSYQHRSIAIREELLEPFDPYLSESYYNASYTYYVERRYDEALFYTKKALKIRRKILFQAHHQLIKTIELKNAIIMAKKGQHNEIDH